MGVSKVEFGGDTLIDLTEDSVTPETMMKGTTAHNSAGEPIEGTFDPDIYQTKTDDSLETEDKTIVGAINEVNGKTVDKIANINDYKSSIELDEESGIVYEFALRQYIDNEDSLIHTSGVTKTYPFAAGENVTFSVEGNVVKINATGGGSSGFKMPQIRFANFQKVELWDEETETLSTRYRFTVENLGGGTLQVGDKLQICCRRKYPNGKKKLRRMADIEITENDLNQRFLKIEVDPEDESVQKWLFRNDRNQSSVTTLSAMYFRLKRVTKYSDSDGMECNAIFSNVEQVWKTYIPPINGGWELNIK